MVLSYYHLLTESRLHCKIKVIKHMFYISLSGSLGTPFSLIFLQWMHRLISVCPSILHIEPALPTPYIHKKYLIVILNMLCSNSIVEPIRSGGLFMFLNDTPKTTILRNVHRSKMNIIYVESLCTQQQVKNLVNVIFCKSGLNSVHTLGPQLPRNTSAMTWHCLVYCVFGLCTWKCRQSDWRSQDRCRNCCCSMRNSRKILGVLRWRKRGWFKDTQMSREHKHGWG